MKADQLIAFTVELQKLCERHRVVITGETEKELGRIFIYPKDLALIEPTQSIRLLKDRVVMQHSETAEPDSAVVAYSITSAGVCKEDLFEIAMDISPDLIQVAENGDKVLMEDSLLLALEKRERDAMEVMNRVMTDMKNESAFDETPPPSAPESTDNNPSN